jgi:hypothetical protein
MTSVLVVGEVVPLWKGHAEAMSFLEVLMDEA